MQSHEERAEAMLHTAGGSLTVGEQRIALRRLVLAEDGIQEYKDLSRQQQASIDTLVRMQERHMGLRSGLLALAGSHRGIPCTMRSGLIKRATKACPICDTLAPCAVEKALRPLVASLTGD